MSHDLENEFADLARELRAARPAPEPEFTERLDRIVEDHFPPEWTDEVSSGRSARGRMGGLLEDLRRRWNGRRVLLPAMAGLASVMLVAVVVAVGTNQNGGDDSGGGVAQTTTEEIPPSSSGGASADSAAQEPMPESAGSAGGVLYGEALKSAPESTSATDDAYTRAAKPAVPGGSRERAVALEAEITLGTDPGGVQDVANDVVSVTDDHNGIVMDSSVKDGEAGDAGASFSLLIPSTQIESAVADLSEIADLKSRSQELIDITAPTNRTEDAVADSKARIQSLLGELEEAPDESTRQELENQIRFERYLLKGHETRLKRLERRADYTPVSVRVETGGESSSDEDSSGWGLGDAVDDAGKLLGVAAGVTVLALAVAIPIGIVVLIALAINRAWVRRSRRRALGDD